MKTKKILAKKILDCTDYNQLAVEKHLVIDVTRRELGLMLCEKMIKEGIVHFKESIEPITQRIMHRGWIEVVVQEVTDDETCMEAIDTILNYMDEQKERGLSFVSLYASLYTMLKQLKYDVLVRKISSSSEEGGKQ